LVRLKDVPLARLIKGLLKGAGEKVPLKRNGYFQRRPHLRSQIFLSDEIGRLR